MSRSIDLFIDAPLDLDQLAEEITRLTGFAFAQVPGTLHLTLQNGDVLAELGVHDFVDDRELLFTRYRYVVTAEVGSQRLVNDSPEAALLRRIFATLKADRRFPSLLVFDLQHLIDRSGPTPSAVTQ
jgi:hypothetical protein